MSDQANGLVSPLLRRARIAQVRPFLRGRVLDFGCGVGVLSAYCSPHNYLGIDRDAESLRAARRKYPSRCFAETISSNQRFDTVVALAVIEHVVDPVMLLRQLASHLVPGGRIMLTTPHPAFHEIHSLGARIGLFSREADDEHETLLDRAALIEVANAADLEISYYQRFLFWTNQFCILEPVT